MTDTIPSAVYGKPLILGQEYNRGSQGTIWRTDDANILVKQFEPAFISDNPTRQQELSRKAESAYRAFCAVNKGHKHALRCLPREYLTVRGQPAYVMQKAEGELLQTLMRHKKITAENKFPLAQALARALHQLHTAQLVHADPHPENYVVHQDQTGWTVSVLDIDGGGLLSPPGPVYPMSQPKRFYKAPELATMHWQTLSARGWFFAPDHWALAVLLYQILVDYAGPFCRVETHPNPLVTDYIPFKPDAYRDPAASWPQPWQEALLRQAKLSDQMIALFTETFQHRFDLETRPRPTAARWAAALGSATTPPSPRSVYTVLTASRLNRPAVSVAPCLGPAHPAKTNGTTGDWQASLKQRPTETSRHANATNPTASKAPERYGGGHPQNGQHPSLRVIGRNRLRTFFKKLTQLRA